MAAVPRVVPPSEEVLFAGGDPGLKYLPYKVGCQNEVIYFNKRLQYERKGTNLECLKLGYGKGMMHIKHQGQITDEDNVGNPSWIEYAKQQKRVFEDWDTPLAFWPPSRERDVDRPDIVDNPDLPQTQIVFRDIPITNENGVLLNGVLYAIERMQPRTTDVARNAHATAFFGIVRNTNPFIKRSYRFLDHRFDIERVRSVFNDEETDTMCMSRLNPRGTLLFAMPLLGPHLQELHRYELGNVLEPFVLCEVDFTRSKIIFYFDFGALANVDLEPYKSIMVQQFVPPRDPIWRVQYMHLDNPISLVWALVRRIRKRGLQSEVVQDDAGLPIVLFAQPLGNDDAQIPRQQREILQYVGLLDNLF